MPRYVALLRGVSPLNARMGALARAFEAAGFRNVRTIIASGNVAFDARSTSEEALASRAEYFLEDVIGRGFLTIIRSQAHLQALVARDPWTAWDIPDGAKRIVTFLREPPTEPPTLSLAVEGARVLGAEDGEVFSVYLPTMKGPAFMTLVERTFDRQVTTRSWDTVVKCARA